MHTARQLKSNSFSAQVSGQDVALDEVLPNWAPHDRFGIVIDQPLGALGASLLIQAATSQFYDAVSGRRDTTPQYPEIYAFHLDRRCGELSPFDFWPPRKEMVVGAAEDLIGAINDRAITRLAVPDTARPRRVGPLFWADIMALRERVVQCFAYSETGRVESADFTLAARTDELERNAERATDLELRVRTNEKLTNEERRLLAPGPVTDQEIVAGRAHVESLLGDVSRQEIAVARRRRAALRTGDLSTESYGCMLLGEALELLGIDEAAGIR